MMWFIQNLPSILCVMVILGYGGYVCYRVFVKKKGGCHCGGDCSGCSQCPGTSDTGKTDKD